MCCWRTRRKGPPGEAGARLKKSLEGRGQRLPLLGSDDVTANRAYIKEFVLKADAELGKKYGLKYAEQFHYIGLEKPAVDDYIKRNALPL